MSWLRRRKNEDDAAVALLEQEFIVDHRLIASGPLLAVLVPDIAGISSFKLRLTESVEEAEEQITGLRPDVRRGIHAFWALQEQPKPTDDMHVEALVLIRASEGSDLVYIVSFLDLESALSFTRFEVRRGLYLGNVLIYWAAFAQVSEQAGAVTFHPRTPPKTMPSWPDQTLSIAPEYHPAPQVEDRVVAEPEPAVETEDAIDRYLRERGKRDLEEAEHLVTDRIETPEPHTIESEPPSVEDVTPAAAPPAFREPSPMADRIVVPQREVEVEPEIEDAAPMIPPPPVEEPVVAATPEIIDPPVAAPEPVAVIPPESEASIEIEEPVAQAASEATIEIEEPIVADEPELLEEPVALIQPAAIEPEIEDELFSEIEEERAALAEAIVLQHPVLPESEDAVDEHTLLDEGAESGMLVEEEPSARLTGALEGFSGDEESAAEAARQRKETELERLYRAAEVRSMAGDEEIERPLVVASTEDPTMTPVKPYDEFNIAYEVERLLRNRRWTDKTAGDDFDGFKSPPGRF